MRTHSNPGSVDDQVHTPTPPINDKIHQEPAHQDEGIENVTNDRFQIPGACALAILTALLGEDTLDDPTTLKEAKSRPDWADWKLAIDNEYESLLRNNT